MSEEYTKGPLTFEIAKWYGYVLAAMYMLYGGVQIILGVLDRNYEGIESWMIFLLIGIILIFVVVAFRSQKKWGWGGMLLLNGIVLILAALGVRESLNIILLVLSAAVLALLLAPATRNYVDGRA